MNTDKNLISSRLTVGINDSIDFVSDNGQTKFYYRNGASSSATATDAILVEILTEQRKTRRLMEKMVESKIREQV